MRTNAKAASSETYEYLYDLFAAFGPISVRRMFSGAGIFLDGLMFALVIDGVIYLRADEEGQSAFEREGCTPFSYATKEGRRTVMAYWRMPERLYDEPEELAGWARTALAAARQKRKRSRSGAAPAAKRKPAVKRPARGK